LELHALIVEFHARHEQLVSKAKPAIDLYFLGDSITRHGDAAITGPTSANGRIFHGWNAGNLAGGADGIRTASGECRMVNSMA